MLLQYCRLKEAHIFLPNGSEIVDDKRMHWIENGTELMVRATGERDSQNKSPTHGTKKDSLKGGKNESAIFPELLDNRGEQCTTIAGEDLESMSSILESSERQSSSTEQSGTCESTKNNESTEGKSSCCQRLVSAPSTAEIEEGDIFTEEKQIELGHAGNVESRQCPCIVHILADKSDLEGDAVTQLHATVSSFPSICLAVGMPDLHPGPRFPIGAAFAAKGQVLPFLVGNDVGCGMTLFPTSLKNKESSKQAEKWSKSLESMEGPWEGDTGEWLSKYGVEATQFDRYRFP